MREKSILFQKRNIEPAKCDRPEQDQLIHLGSSRGCTHYCGGFDLFISQSHLRQLRMAVGKVFLYFNHSLRLMNQADCDGFFGGAAEAYTEEKNRYELLKRKLGISPLGRFAH